eukprot:1604678-Rhodomonas_salina.3
MRTLNPVETLNPNPENPESNPSNVHQNLLLHPLRWPEADTAGGELGRWVTLYSACVFLQWTRVLRILSVSKSLGPLVIIVKRTGADIAKFALVWFILLLAFSVLLRGTNPDDYLHPAESDLQAAEWTGDPPSHVHAPKSNTRKLLFSTRNAGSCC